jgi:acyl-CoA thioesterase FadM
LEAQIFAPVPGEQTLVVYAWPISVKGRKLNAGTAIATAEGRVLAIAHSTWILLQSE